MPLHRMGSVTIGVPNLAETARYYEDFGLAALGDNRFATRDGGEQLRLVGSPTRRVLEVRIGADDQDDVDRVARQLQGLDLEFAVKDGRVESIEPIAGFRAVIEVMPRLAQPMEPATPYNGPGRVDRENTRAPAIM